MKEFKYKNHHHLFVALWEGLRQEINEILDSCDISEIYGKERERVILLKEASRKIVDLDGNVNLTYNYYEAKRKLDEYYLEVQEDLLEKMARKLEEQNK